MMKKNVSPWVLLFLAMVLTLDAPLGVKVLHRYNAFEHSA
jgi:hypothetical protein